PVGGCRSPHLVSRKGESDAMTEGQQITLHGLIGKLPDAEYLRRFFGVQGPDQGNPTHLLVVDLLIAVLWVSLMYPLWFYPVLHGIEAAKRSGRSPAWMWFGVHPLFGWITYLVLRSKTPAGSPSTESEGAVQQTILATPAQTTRRPAKFSDRLVAALAAVGAFVGVFLMFVCILTVVFAVWPDLVLPLNRWRWTQTAQALGAVSFVGLLTLSAATYRYVLARRTLKNDRTREGVGS
ncbi:MAG: hypothetical protein ABSC03_15150, partial [Verrucomicrobiota bacterium]